MWPGAASAKLLRDKAFDKAGNKQIEEKEGVCLVEREGKEKCWQSRWSVLLPSTNLGCRATLAGPASADRLATDSYHHPLYQLHREQKIR